MGKSVVAMVRGMCSYCGMSRKRQRSRIIDFSAGSTDQLARCETALKEQPLGALVTQALLCRAALRLLADQSPKEFLAAVRRQLADEYRRFGLPPEDDPGGGDDAGEELTGAA